LALLGYLTWDVKSIYAVLLQIGRPPAMVFWTVETIAGFQFEILYLLDRIYEPNAPRRASEKACKYCKARMLCPEARVLVTKCAIATTEQGLPLMSPEDLGKFLDICAVAEDIIAAARKQAKEMLSAAQAVPGWKLKPGSNRETITAPERVFSRFCDLGGTNDQFMWAVSVTKSGLKDAIKTLTGEKGQALTNQLDAMIEGCIEIKTSAPTLVRE
jgi:hypothetical protein